MVLPPWPVFGFGKSLNFPGNVYIRYLYYYSFRTIQYIFELTLSIFHFSRFIIGPKPFLIGKHTCFPLCIDLGLSEMRIFKVGQNLPNTYYLLQLRFVAWSQAYYSNIVARCSLSCWGSAHRCRVRQVARARAPTRRRKPVGGIPLFIRARVYQRWC